MDKAISAVSATGEAVARIYHRKPASGLLAFGKRLRRRLNAFLALTSLVPNDPFVEPALLPGIGELARHWHDIRAELLPLMNERCAIPPLGAISPDHRRIATNDSWRSYFFVGHGYRVEDNCNRCPVTAGLIDRIPGVIVAFYSIFEPGTDVPPHRGVTKAMLNVHLPLIVPKGRGKCQLAAGGETRQWREGELLVLDETWPHEACNLTDGPRVVLFLQVRRPMRWPGRLVGSVFLWAMRRTTYVQEARRELGAQSR